MQADWQVCQQRPPHHQMKNERQRQRYGTAEVENTRHCVAIITSQVEAEELLKIGRYASGYQSSSRKPGVTALHAQQGNDQRGMRKSKWHVADIKAGTQWIAARQNALKLRPGSANSDLAKHTDHGQNRQKLALFAFYHIPREYYRACYRPTFFLDL
jgi:hypothetical protein